MRLVTRLSEKSLEFEFRNMFLKYNQFIEESDFHCGMVLEKMFVLYREEKKINKPIIILEVDKKGK